MGIKVNRRIRNSCLEDRGWTWKGNLQLAGKIMKMLGHQHHLAATMLSTKTEIWISFLTRKIHQMMNLMSECLVLTKKPKVYHWCHIIS